jgi:hypothetical protein
MAAGEIDSCPPGCEYPETAFRSHHSQIRQKGEMKMGELLEIDTQLTRKEIDPEIFKQELTRNYSYLKPGVGCVIAAKNIRIELKKAFPTIKFSVRTDKFSGGNSVDVEWTDGPTTKQVESITSKYQYGSFDGMTDCYNYGSRLWNEVFGGSKYVSERRNFSEDLVEIAIIHLAKEYNAKLVPTVDDYNHGNASNIPSPIENTHDDRYCDWQSLITRTSSELAL